MAVLWLSVALSWAAMYTTSSHILKVCRLSRKLSLFLQSMPWLVHHDQCMQAYIWVTTNLAIVLHQFLRILPDELHNGACHAPERDACTFMHAQRLPAVCEASIMVIALWLHMVMLVCKYRTVDLERKAPGRNAVCRSLIPRLAQSSD